MSSNRGAATSNGSLQPARHISKPSVDTNASGIAESTISFSQFPSPPDSIPTTPIRTGFTPTSLSPVQPLVPRKPVKRPGATSVRSRNGSSASQATHATAQLSESLSNPQRSLAPYDWHDGSSRIDVDPTESRLLSTSFITSLLQENKDLRRANRNSYTSDAFSGISEMTYPPPAPYQHEFSKPRYGNPYRPLGPRKAPPSAFNPISESSNRMSSDSDTLHSAQGYPGVLRNLNPSYNTSTINPVVVGIAPATLRTIPGSSRPPSTQTVPMSIEEKDVKYGLSGHDMDDDSILRFKAQGQLPPQPEPYSQSQASVVQRRIRDTEAPPTPQTRQSTYSLKSLAPSFVSRISVPTSVKRMFNRHKKVLPPVPRIPDIPIAIENQTRKAEESAPLPDLATRAETLHALLEKGYHPHHSISTYQDTRPHMQIPSDTMVTVPSATFQDGLYNGEAWRPLRPLYYSDVAGQPSSQPSLLSRNEASPPPAACNIQVNRRTKILIAIFTTAVIAGIITAAIVVVKRKQSGSSNCPDGLAGAACNLNSTCVCLSESRCIAQNLVDLIPSVNQAFSGNFTGNDVYNSLWYTQGSTSRNDCSPQSLLVDVGKGLKESQFPNRTRWAQAALLWNVIQSQDLEAADKMQRFVQKAPWSGFSVDGPTNNGEDKYTATFSGYTFNFAAQTITHPPASFISQGQPTRDQIGRVGLTAQSALDRIYTFAQASSAQRENALKNYWTTTLSQRSDDLPIFKALLSVSPILLPFNASSSSIRNLFSNSAPSTFPPPLACYPGLSSQQSDLINSLETSVFELPTRTTPASTFSTECYPDRPVYGILDVLRLRLPFLDSRTGTPRQATILRSDAVPRAVIYVGEMLSGTFPGTNSTPSSNSSQLDPRQFGTLAFPNHIVLQYLTSMPVETATILVKFVLDTGNRIPVPPDNSSSLFPKLSSIPVLEVALFGSVGPADVSGTVSSLNSSSQALFFGTDAGAAFRQWSISSYGGSVSWAENATSPRIVKDGSLNDSIISRAWQATSDSIRLNAPRTREALVASLESTGKFTPE